MLSKIEVASRLGIRCERTVDKARLLWRASWAIHSSSCSTEESGKRSTISSRRSSRPRSEKHLETFMLVGPLHPLCVQRNPPRDSLRSSFSGLVSPECAWIWARTNTSSNVSPLNSCTRVSGEVSGVSAGRSGVIECPMLLSQAYPSPVVPHPL